MQKRLNLTFTWLLRSVDQYHFWQKTVEESLAISRVRRNRAVVVESTPRSYFAFVNDKRRKDEFHSDVSSRPIDMLESMRGGIRRSGSADEEDPSMQAWHLQSERPYRKDINAWNPGRKLGSTERRTLPLRFLSFSFSFSSYRDSLSPQCDDRVYTTTLRYRKIRPRWLEKSRPTIKADNHFTSRKVTLPVAVKESSRNIRNRFCSEEGVHVFSRTIMFFSVKNYLSVK